MIMPGLVLLTLGAFILVKLPVITGQCDGSVRLIDLRAYPPNGVIYSPNYPSSYPRNENCYWRIRAPYNQKVLIYFTSLDLESCCTCDYVKIYDGSNYLSRVLTKGCNSSFPPPVYSSYTNIYMAFRSDGSLQRRGFVAHYKALRQWSGCPSIDPAASAGVIYSPNFPWNYPYSTSCNWTITAPSWQRIRLTFLKFNLENPYIGCSDYVEVRGRGAYSVYRRKFCGYHNPGPILLYGNMIVTFFSDNSISSSGFMAFYQIGNIYTLATTAPPVTFPYTHYTARPHFTIPYTEGPTDQWYYTEKAATVKAAAIAVPIVVGVVLFGIIFAVIFCTKITRSVGAAGISYELSPQPLSQGTEMAAPIVIREQYPPPSTSQSFSLNTLSDPPTSAMGHSQGFTNTSLEGDTA